MSNRVLLAFLLILSARLSAQTTHTPVEEAMKTYLSLKENLVASDSVNAASNAKLLSEAIGKLRIKKANALMLDTLSNVRNEAMEIAKNISETQSIKVQRKSLAALSVKCWYWLQHQPQPAFTIFEQRCPMTGEVWLSSEETIKNPYYPRNMLTCGEVINQTGEAKAPRTLL
ncbi:membrane fusion protein, Cu(I)/Ag(I) efflux system [Filimonas lacunae]|uniref:Membrane fusion protein, Cu(I)/Ag(I) efflux system n=1 Tax=Filimonas lacunae TaxID=477680 RepID=A0A173MBY4_9BACT|nr:DUF3347 domain-containing protein [Filimonas lacunae]BAV05010.1 Co/Zn/Cd efflux system membrane fusion protein [Filimonas lacunae]SIT33659.1 membrane fusion protein, Cu(I)/Ag(I) efflux system [Filimonas lacunae]